MSQNHSDMYDMLLFESVGQGKALCLQEYKLITCLSVFVTTAIYYLNHKLMVQHFIHSTNFSSWYGESITHFCKVCNASLMGKPHLTPSNIAIPPAMNSVNI